MRLSLLGLGPMGAPMARNLLAGGALTVWNRTASRAAPFAELGAVVAPTPAAAAGDVVLTVLPDLVQVESLLEREDGLLAGWRAAGIAAPVLVVHGTISPVAVAGLARRLAAEHGVQVVDAPLSGGTVGARDATLSIMVGGADEPVARVLPVFERLGRTVRHLGPSGAGATAKLCNQIVVAGTVAVVSEALLLARSAGLDPATVVELLQGGLARTAVLEQKSRKWLDEDFAEGGSARNQLKDLRFVAESAAAEGVALPTTAAVTALFERMIAEGDGDLDHTGVHRTLAGLTRRPEEPHA
ncbi:MULTISPECIES: NAD(P)-dependent oxidoreductase [unclassified Rathayibacter]|uniref:NAD(P)-dependent oxidoreductase n=1 Tax=unclassified Rathayibacter TaxID=2609250 RepID=UPI0010EC86AE|nr:MULTISPECIES: NAD(P)-dependent oxidoreductase [unclassified Rathayibacter]TCL83236.1 2-hydroxy-3-oxopropionate reductase [Rathayibacter sp. PhB192]TCM28734.1 2-hydroxy-3-oxopropionate reductase [Rathayibacter sp. PhB179]